MSDDVLSPSFQVPPDVGECALDVLDPAAVSRSIIVLACKPWPTRRSWPGLGQKRRL